MQFSVSSLVLGVRVLAMRLPQPMRAQATGFSDQLSALAPRTADLLQTGALLQLQQCVADLCACPQQPMWVGLLARAQACVDSIARMLGEGDAAAANCAALSNLDATLAAHNLQRRPDTPYVPGDCGFDSVRWSLLFMGHACPPTANM